MRGMGVERGISGELENGFDLYRQEAERMAEEMDAVDDVSGEPLNAKMVMEARRTEMQLFRRMGVYTKVSRQECVRLGLKPIAVRWVDVNKGDSQTPDYRSRLVAKEYRRNSEPDMFAATPPLEALKLLLSILASTGAVPEGKSSIYKFDEAWDLDSRELSGCATRSSGYPSARSNNGTADGGIAEELGGANAGVHACRNGSGAEELGRANVGVHARVDGGNAEELGGTNDGIHACFDGDCAKELGGRGKILIVDIKRAFFHAKVEKPIFVQSPP